MQCFYKFQHQQNIKQYFKPLHENYKPYQKSGIKKLIVMIMNKYTLINQ